MSFLGGHLLIASPYLADRNFFRSVVLVVSHDEEHAFGLLLNRPSRDSLTNAWHKLSGSRYERPEMVRTGGPMRGPLMVLHRQVELSDTRVVPDVYLSTTHESVDSVMDTAAKPLIPLVGYSGWGAGQLEVELEVGGWMTLPATESIVFADPAEQWNLASRQVSNGILAGVDLKHTPQDPRWN